MYMNDWVRITVTDISDPVEDTTDELTSAIFLLSTIGPDSLFRMILSKWWVYNYEPLNTPAPNPLHWDAIHMFQKRRR